MRTPLLLAALVLAAAHALAAAPAAPAADPRKKALDEIAAWRGFLPRPIPPSPLTQEFEPRLDKVQTAFQTAQAPDALAKAQKDFEAWQHDFTAASCRAMPAGCSSTKQLYAFSAAQRATIADFARQRAEILDPKLRQAGNAAGSAKLFFDNDTGRSAYILPPGAFGSPPPVAKVNSASTLPRLSTVNAPPPPPGRAAFSLAALSDWLDYGGISETAIRAVEGIKNQVAGFGKLLTGFAGSCYYGAKWLMIKAGMLPPEVASPGEIGEIGIGSGHAYMMNAALKKNPALQSKLHVRPLRLSDITDAEVKLIPEKTMFVFDRGCAGMSDESGHIEIKFDDDKLAQLPASAFYRAGRGGPKYKPSIAGNEVLACSDGCAVRTAAYLRTYGRRGCLNAYAPVLDRPAPPPVSRVPGI